MDDVRLYVAASSAIGGHPHTIADGGRNPRNCVLRRPVLSGCAREVPAMDHEVLVAQVAENIDVVDECRKAREEAQVRAAQSACQIVNLGDVRHKIALVSRRWADTTFLYRRPMDWNVACTSIW